MIQKYIERPLIIKDNCPKNLRNKKFDIRQWVLVKSFVPLRVYSFSTAYLRICSQDFDLLDIKNLYKHLTNYSINKSNFQGFEDESILPLDTLKKIIKDEFNKTWEKDVEPKLRDLIITTLKTGVDSVEQRSSSFELYGFDIMLDSKCVPWLIEVNLSPACAERADWLTVMLDDMATGLMVSNKTIFILRKKSLGKKKIYIYSRILFFLKTIGRRGPGDFNISGN